MLDAMHMWHAQEAAPEQHNSTTHSIALPLHENKSEPILPHYGCCLVPPSITQIVPWLEASALDQLFHP